MQVPHTAHRSALFEKNTKCFYVAYTTSEVNLVEPRDDLEDLKAAPAKKAF